jgi:prefoldin beta subunit
MAEPTIPPQVQQQLANLQALNANYQATAQQRAQFEAMRAENQAALEALEALAEDAPVYRNVGSLLLRDDRKAALERLKEDVETGEVRIQRLKKQEETLREQLGQLQQKIQAALKG